MNKHSTNIFSIRSDIMYTVKSGNKVMIAGATVENNIFKRRILTVCTVFLSILCCVIIAKNHSYAAYNDSARILCYRPVEVKEGDSLWSIAKDNMTEEWKSTGAYVKAIKEFNSMESNNIYAGTYISIPYYDEPH